MCERETECVCVFVCEREKESACVKEETKNKIQNLARGCVGERPSETLCINVVFLFEMKFFI